MEIKDSANARYLLDQPGIQCWSRGTHFPAVIVRIDRHSQTGQFLETYHRVILGDVTMNFHGINTYDQALRWAMEKIYGH